MGGRCIIMKTYYLVDTENVGLKPIAYSNVYYFVAENYNYDGDLVGSENKIIRVSHHHEKNALDYYISAYLGKLLSDNRGSGDSEYIIVSNDRGYDTVVNQWTSLGYSVCRKSYWEACDYSSPESLLMRNRHKIEWSCVKWFSDAVAFDMTDKSSFCRLLYSECPEIGELGKMRRKSIATQIWEEAVEPVVREYKRKRAKTPTSSFEYLLNSTRPA